MQVPGTTNIDPPNDQNNATIFVQTAEMINATAPTTDLTAGTMSEASNVGNNSMTEITNALIAEMNHGTASSTPNVYFASGHTPQANALHKTLRVTSVARKDTLLDPSTAKETATVDTTKTVPENISPTVDPTRLLETQITGANRLDLDALSIM